MDSNKSSFLHCVRWLSALLVLFGHSQLIGKGGAFVFISSHAHAAVMVFFVLSGYVIASTVDRRRESGYVLKDYFADRFSRIYSVLIPAIILTIVLDAVGIYFFNHRYSDPALLPQDNYAIRLIINLLSMQGIWGYRVQFGSNPALWSIGYEFCYYILYGLIVWRPKYWRLAFLFIAVIVGPKMLAYGLIWLIGVAAYRAQEHIKVNFLFGAFLLVVANYMFQYNPIDFIPELIRDFVFSIAVMVFLLSNPRFPSSKFILATNRQMAEFSYSFYAYHYPIMFIGYSFITPTPVSYFGMVFISLIAARVLYEITEKKRSTIRSLIV